MNCPCGAPLTDKQVKAVKMAGVGIGPRGIIPLCDKCWAENKTVKHKFTGKNKSNRGEK